jgi:hypothetical protein
LASNELTPTRRGTLFIRALAQGLLAAIDIAHRQSRQPVLAYADLSRGEAQPDA